MKIYTRTGDGGDTGLFGGSRVSKASLRIVAIGELDALNAGLGLVATHDTNQHFVERIRTIQAAIFDIGAEVATQPGKTEKLSTEAITKDDVAHLETWIDEADAALEPLKTFVLPGGTPLSAQLHWVRTEARRAERSLVALGQHSEAGVRQEVLQYVNRLSDLFFTWARLANQRANVPDVPWVARGR